MTFWDHEDLLGNKIGHVPDGSAFTAQSSRSTPQGKHTPV